MNHAKTIVVGISSLLSALLGVLYVPVLLMVLCNIIDYATGLMAAPNRGGISSYQSIKGITKKVAMWILVIVGAIVDSLLKYCTSTFGFEIPFNFFVASVVAVWIICNELISILENLVDIGVNIPSFLLPLVKKLQTTIEKKVEVEGDNGDKQDDTGEEH